jgi:hypothetical protein
MTYQEAQELQKAAEARMIEIEGITAAERFKREKYAIVAPEPEYQYDYRGMWRTAKETLISTAFGLNQNDLTRIEDKFTTMKSIDYSKVYPCPECGAMRLEVGFFGDLDPSDKRAVFCSACCKVMPAEPVDFLGAWENLHEWLIEEGFLDKGIEMPR